MQSIINTLEKSLSESESGLRKLKKGQLHEIYDPVVTESRITKRIENLKDVIKYCKNQIK